MRAARPPGLPIFVHQRGSSDGDEAFPPSTSLNKGCVPSPGQVPAGVSRSGRLQADGAGAVA